MPLYEYRCLCGRLFEALRPIGDHDGVICPNCQNGLVELVPSSFSFAFRGRGWKPYTVEGSTGEEKITEEIRNV